MGKNKIKYSAFQLTALKYKGSVIKHVIPKLLFFTIWTIGVILINQYAIRVAIDKILITLLTFVVSLLLVFRTNTAYDRYWEGRRLWSNMTVAIRTITRNIWVHVDCIAEHDKTAKKKAIDLLIAFSYTVKHHLREEYGHDYPDLKGLINHIPYLSSSSEPLIMGSSYNSIGSETPLKIVVKDSDGSLSNNIPIEMTYLISAYIGEAFAKAQISPPVFTVFIANINTMVDALSGFERILGSPIPTAYAVHLSQITWLFCLGLPFQLLSILTVELNRDWVVLPVVIVTVFTVFGIINIGEEIENPFGYDDNDLPLDEYCKILEDEIRTMVKRPPPSVEVWVHKKGHAC